MPNRRDATGYVRPEVFSTQSEADCREDTDRDSYGRIARAWLERGWLKTLLMANVAQPLTKHQD